MKVVHPNVVRTFEHGITTEGERFIVMEFIDGVSLKFVREATKVGVRAKVKLLAQAADALAAVHAAGFIHHDVNPNNFLVDRENNVKLIDFGLAVPNTPAFQRPGNRTGMLQYMAPELIRREPTDERIDIFGFGVMAFELLTDKLPYGGGQLAGPDDPEDQRRPDRPGRRQPPALRRPLRDPPQDPRPQARRPLAQDVDPGRRPPRGQPPARGEGRGRSDESDDAGSMRPARSPSTRPSGPRHVPEADQPVLAGRGQGLAVGAEGERPDLPPVLRAGRASAAGQVPDEERPARVARGQGPAVGVERERQDRLEVPLQRPDLPAGRDVPELDPAVLVGRGQRSGRRARSRPGPGTTGSPRSGAGSRRGRPGPRG